MKKILAVLVILTMIIFMAACGNESSNNEVPPNQQSYLTDGNDNILNNDIQNNSMESSDQPSNNEQSENTSSQGNYSEDTAGGSNILVAYFSRVGNTVWIDGVDAITSASINIENGEFTGNAQMLAQMAQEITGGDLFLIQTEETYPSDYRETTNVASIEQADNARPALASHVENMDQYDTIVLIYPNWWGTLPQPLFTFLEEYDFSGKTILPLCTHEGSRMGSSERAIAEICPDAILLTGLAVRGSDASSAQSDVETWINNSGILE